MTGVQFEGALSEEHRRRRAGAVLAGLAVVVFLTCAAGAAWIAWIDQPAMLGQVVLIGPRCGRLEQAISGRERSGWRTYILDDPAAFAPARGGAARRPVRCVINIHPDPTQVTGLRAVPPGITIRGRQLLRWGPFAVVQR